MRLYAPATGLRTRQVLADVAALVGIWLFVRLGRFVHDLVAGLAAPGRAIEEAGERLSGGALRGGDRVDDLPLVGDALRRPFEAVASGGEALIDAGVAQQDATATLALVLGLVVAGLPVAWVLARWLPWRVRWLREAAAVEGLLRTAPDGVALLAHRALASRSVRTLWRAEPDPWAAFTEGRHGRLAALELDALGLRLPAAPRPAEVPPSG
jgi:hypothetical protein